MNKAFYYIGCFSLGFLFGVAFVNFSDSRDESRAPMMGEVLPRPGSGPGLYIEQHVAFEDARTLVRVRDTSTGTLCYVAYASGNRAALALDCLPAQGSP